jgi:hypothetical protein
MGYKLAWQPSLFWYIPKFIKKFGIPHDTFLFELGSLKILPFVHWKPIQKFIS